MPGQTVTVRASGLQAGGTAHIDYLPDLVRLASVVVGADGGFTRDVRIPANTRDGPKQIVVTGIAATGRYAYLATNLVMKGPPATARLSDSTLVPGQALHIEGTRFLAGTEVAIVIFPERQYLGTPRAGADGRFSINVTLPRDLRNGQHGIVVAALNASGGYSYLTFPATVTGGRGTVPAGGGLGSDILPIPPLGDSAGTSLTTTSKPRAGIAPPRPSTGGQASSNLALLVIVGSLLALLAFVGGSWFGSPDGRRWLRERSRRRRQRAHERRRSRATAGPPPPG